MKDTTSTGNLGENLACQYLEKLGCRIIERNFRRPFGEIDVIVKDRGGVLVFVEVKAMRQNADRQKVLKNGAEKSYPHDIQFNPEDHLNFAKLSKLNKICQYYANAHPELIRDEGWRIDLIALTIYSNDVEINYYKNITLN